MDYNGLIHKTIYDLCNDEELIHEIMPIEKDKYIKGIKQNPAINAMHLLKLAEMTNNKDLEAAVYSQFQDVLGFHKNHPDDKIYWKETPGEIGKFLFSFDKKIVFNMFADYPYKLTKEQKQIFDKENPYWAEFFSDREK